MQYPSHKCLLEKSCLDCLRILTMHWLLKDPVVIMKEIMFWLFKDSIAAVAWLNFDHAQSNSKKWPKKIKLPQMTFFSWKTTNKIFMYLLAPFALQDFLKILRADPELWGCVIFGPKVTHLSWTKFFGYNPLLLLLSTYWPFSLCKILKYFLLRIQNYDAQFLDTKWPISPNENFFRKPVDKPCSFHSCLSTIYMPKTKVRY